MTKLDRYIAIHLLQALLLATLVLAPLFALLDFIQQLDDVGKKDFGVGDALLYEAALFPRHVLDLMPFLALLGTTLALVGLARGNELTAMQTAGVSVARVGLAVVQVMLLLIVSAAILEEEFVSPLQQQALQIRNQKLTGSQLTQGRGGLWIHRGQRFVNIGRIKDGYIPTDIEIFEFDEDQKLKLFLKANNASIANPDEWVLRDVLVKRRENGQLVTETLAETSWEPYLGAAEIDLLKLPSGSLSPLQIQRYVSYLETSGQSTERQRLALWQKLALPVSSIALALIAVPFSFGSTRAQGSGKKVVLAGVAGVSFLLANQILANIGLIYDLWAPLVTMLPALLILGISIWLLRRAR